MANVAWVLVMLDCYYLVYVVAVEVKAVGNSGITFVVEAAGHCEDIEVEDAGSSDGIEVEVAGSSELAVVDIVRIAAVDGLHHTTKCNVSHLGAYCIALCNCYTHLDAGCGRSLGKVPNSIA